MTAKLKQLAKPRILQDSRVPDPNDDTRHLSVKDAIVLAIRRNPRRATAARFAGITPSTLSDWLTRGEAALAASEEKQGETQGNPDGPFPNWDHISDVDRPYVELVMDVSWSVAAREMTLVGHVNQAAKGDWRAAVAALQADERGSWCPPARVEVSGPGGGPVASVLRLECPEDVRALGETLRLRAERRALDVGEADDS